MFPVQFYGLIFLLGSFTVAAVSDLRRMLAQRDFAEVWFVFTGIFFVYDAYLSLSENFSFSNFILKWAIIGIFALLSYKFVNLLFSLSLMDITAICAVGSLLDITYLVAFYIMLIVINEILKPFLKDITKRHITPAPAVVDRIDVYPFLPVVLVSTFLILVLAWFDVLSGVV